MHDTLFLKYHPIYERIWRNAPLYKDEARINEIKRLELEFDVIALGMPDKDIRGILGEPSKEFDVIFREEDQFVWWDYTKLGVNSVSLYRFFERNDEIKKLFRHPSRLGQNWPKGIEGSKYYSNAKTVGQRFVYYQRCPQIMFYYRLIEIPDISGLTERNISNYPRLPKKITSILINMLDMKSFEIPYIGNQPFMGIHGSGRLGSVEKYNKKR